MRFGGFCILVAVVGLFALWLKNFSSDLKMPETRDKAIVGTWRAKDHASNVKFSEIQFLSNGTAYCPGLSHITWGTINGKLHLICRASGSDWMNGVYRYAVDKNHRRIKFEKPPLDIIPMTLVRR